MYQTQFAWLPFFEGAVSEYAGDKLAFARKELALGLEKLHFAKPVTLKTTADGDGYAIKQAADSYIISGGDTGLLYGVYAFLMKLHAKEAPETALTTPAFALRMLNHWDNMTGHIERGYSGGTFFYKDNRFCYDENRIKQYARMLCSIGINCISINNVNVHAPADEMILPTLLPEVKKLAAIFRPFGVRLLLAIDYSLPTRHGLTTADPLDKEVQAWWDKTIDNVYKEVPDLAGFLVKADSENRPGPYMYGRNHAEGAGLLSKPLKKHGGVLVWRCFVYNCKQDWRDTATDRPKAAYDNYAHLDGQFDDNVILQVKNGPFDFQVREPITPLFYAMPKTVKALEVQTAQEYTGHQIDLFYMPPQWKEYLQELGEFKPKHICSVTNTGDDKNWTGHDLAQANLYAFGRMAWTGEATPEETAKTWITLTFGLKGKAFETLQNMLLISRDAYEKYTAPLGVCWMVRTQGHYGVQPEGYEYTPWGTYLRTTHTHLGLDRTKTGTGYALQYPDAIRDAYVNLDTCDERLLLFFHRLPFTYRMKDGRTIIQRIYDDHFEGAEMAQGLLESWKTLKGEVPEESYENVLERFERQLINAREWRDVVNTYYHRYCLIEDEKGRKIYD